MAGPDDPPIAPGFKRISGTRSPSEGKYRVQWRSGEISRWEYEPHMLVWKHAGHEFDVIAVQRVD